MKNLAALYRRLENNPETARTSRDTEKTPLINWVIGNNKKTKIFEKKQESLEYAGTNYVDRHCNLTRGCELQIY